MGLRGILSYMILVFITLATILSTLAGGLFALRFSDKLHLIAGFSAGAVIAVAFFDLLPESVALSAGGPYASSIFTLVAIGFIGYMVLDRSFSVQHSHDEEDERHHHHRGKLGAGSLSIHSFIDGAAIGLGFQASPSVGILIATAVLVHDFSDGINTVNLVLKNKGSSRQALRWLTVDAIAPTLGVISTLFFSLPEQLLSVVLALFCGFFLYIGASDLLPESYHRHPNILTTIMTVLGVIVLYIAISLAG